MKKFITVFITVLISAIAFSITCSAWDYPLVKLPDPDDIGSVAALVGTDYSEVETKPYAEWMKVAGDTLYYNSDLDEESYDVKTKVMRTFVEDFAYWADANETKVSTITKQAVYTQVSDEMGDDFTRAIPTLIEATSADVYGALGVFSPFQGVFGTILGFLVIFIMIVLVGSTIIDLVFIGMPKLTEWMLTDDNKGRKVKWVSTDAYQALQRSAETNKSPYVYYFKNRIVSYIILACCILYLLTGQIANLIGWFLDYANRVVQ